MRATASPIEFAAQEYLDAKAAADEAAERAKQARVKLDEARDGETEVAVSSRHVKLVWVPTTGGGGWNSKKLKQTLANWEEFRNVGAPSERLIIQPLTKGGAA